MMKEPTVSVIVTTYNRENYLKETIRSILDQTYSDFELIVVDNFSNYDFFKLVSEFNDPRIRPYQNANNGIIAVNRNYGISKATGKYLAFCDDDDIWLPPKIEIQVSKIYGLTGKYIVSSAMVLFGSSKVEGKILRKRGYYVECEKYINNLIPLSSVLVSNTPDVFFNENPDFVGSEDWGLWLKLFILNYGSIHVASPLIKYRVSSSNYTSSSKQQIDLRAVRILNDLKKEYRQQFNIFYYCIGIISLYLKCVLRTFNLLSLIK